MHKLEPYLTVRESLDSYAGYYRAPRPVDETIELVGLAGKADAARHSSSPAASSAASTSALALIGDPELLFLDEPTTGFDPSARRQVWDVIAGLRELGKTVFLTTHYMDEAQELADRVAIIAHGQIVAVGSPDDARRPRERPGDGQLPAARREVAVADLPGDAAEATLDGDGGVSLQHRATRCGRSTSSPGGRWSGASTSRASRSAAPASRTSTWS